jgi:hypothetical protein
MNTGSKEFMAAVYTIIAFHVIIGLIILYRRTRKKK